MEEETDFIDEHIDDISHGEKIEENLTNAIKEQNDLKRLVDLFILALLSVLDLFTLGFVFAIIFY